MHTLMILIPVHPVTCGDMIFSGHSNTAICIALVWHTYYKWVPRKVNIVKISVWIIAMTACTFLVVTKVSSTRKQIDLPATRTLSSCNVNPLVILIGSLHA